jgi:cytidine deaminase
MITAILFDMDGVLIDSERYISEAAVTYFASQGVQVQPEDFIPHVGAGEDRYLGNVAKQYGVSLDIEQAKMDTYAIYEQLITGKEAALEGVVQFITNAHRAGITMAVATSADRRKMEINLQVMGLDPSWFAVLVNGQDIERKKPFPDIYLKAAAEIGVDIHETLVFEDANNGVQAAKASGSLCGGITTSFAEDQLRKSGADFIIRGLDEFPDFSTQAEFNHLIRRYLARELATKTRNHAYAPYSQFRVGAAIVSASTGRIYPGCNVENSSYGATICAERGALLQAVASEGDFPIEMVVVVSDDDPPAPPCALCLQVIAEFATGKTMVYLYNIHGVSRSYRFGDLLPHPFIFAGQRDRHTCC